MTDTPEFLAHRLRLEGDKTITFFRSMPEGTCELPLYTEGSRWYIRDVIAHFVSTERAFLQLLMNIQKGDPALPDDFSIDRFNEEQVSKLRDLNVERLLNDFKTARDAMVGWVAGLSTAELQKRGSHPFLGATVVAEMIKMIYVHNNLHLRDIKKVIVGQGQV